MTEFKRENLERLTKPQLVAIAVDATKQANNALDQAIAAERKAVPPSVDEADALAGCIRALDAMRNAETTARRNSSNYGMPFTSGPSHWTDENPRPQDATERILRLLAAKYGIALAEVRREPCDRRHVDEISPDQLYSALNFNGMSMR